MKIKTPYRANIHDFADPQEDLHSADDYDSGNEIDEYNNNENCKDAEEKETNEMDVKEDFQSSSNNKRKRNVTDDPTNSTVKKTKKYDKDLYKPPTAEELNQLKETDNLFHSNLFRLQIEEMLNEIKIKDKYKRLFDVWFKNFETIVQSIEETDEYQLFDNTLREKLDVRIPMPDVPKEQKGIFKFLKPSNVSVIGSYAVDAAIGPNATVDVMIEMPNEIFQNQDYQNYRYIKKKAMYLAIVANNISEDIAEHKSFIGNNLRPVLKIVPKGKLGTKVNVLVHISAQEGKFKLTRFQPEKNNVRPGWFHAETENTGLLPTPHYNSLILHDLIMKTHSDKMLMIKEYPNLRDGIILLKVWFIQRELLKGHAAFNGHIIAMFVLYLLSIRKVNTFMSSYQIVRNVWSYLVQVDWTENGITMSQDEDSKNRVKNYHQYYDCVFLDNTGYYNIASHLLRNTYKWIQKEAELSLNYLDSAHADSFQSLFMKKVPFHMAFDHLLWFKNVKVLKNVVKIHSTNNDKLDYGPDYRTQAIRILSAILKEGLTNRIHQICILPNDLEQWECTENGCNNFVKIVIGLELNPESCFSVVDKGPEANVPEADDFRRFWGKKSELRRFQDGSIREAVVWAKGKTLEMKRRICKKIVTFLLANKLGIHKNKYMYIANEVEELLTLPKVRITHFPYGTGEEAALRAINVFNNLEKELMSLTDIPLSIHGVQGSSPVFRYTDVFPPLATTYRSDNKFIKKLKYRLVLSKNIVKAPKYVSPLEVSLQLSASGKWPDELEAFRKTKAAFHLQIAECLRNQYSLVTNASATHVDVYKEGFVFRLQVAHKKEIGCLKQQITQDGVVQYKDNEKSIELENRLFTLPMLTSALHGLYVQQPSFGPTCCLTKRWLSAQLLDNSHMPDIVIELLVASTFLTLAPYRLTQTPQVAFLRMLEMFARGQWSTDPIIVNFNDEMSREDIIAVETLFGTSRDTLPPLFISTPYDHQKSLFTRKAPSALILRRITALAKESLKLFEVQLSENIPMDFKPLFRPPLTEYDCLIHLNHEMNPRRLQAIDVSKEYKTDSWHPYKKHSAEKIPIVDFDPVQCYLRDLRNGYDEFALFFYDTYGGMVIGVLFKPSALENKDFKVSNVNGRKCNNDGQLVLNVSAIIQDFYTLGKGVVKNIDIQSKRFTIT